MKIKEKVNKITAIIAVFEMLFALIPAVVFATPTQTTPSPNPVIPADKAYVTSTGLSEIDWSDVVVPDKDVSYDFEMATDPSTDANGNFTDPSKEVRTDIAESYTAFVPTVDGHYFWHARAVAENLGPSVWSSTWEFYLDNTKPTAEMVHIQSSNINQAWAKDGDTVTVSFTASEPLDQAQIVSTIDNTSTTVVNTSGLNYTFSKQIDKISDPTEGKVPFTIDFKDLAGNQGASVSNTTDGSSVTLDYNAPMLSKDKPENGFQAYLLSEPEALIGDFYVVETNGQVDLTSAWKQVIPTALGSVASYDVSYIATDQAGNASVPYETRVDLQSNPEVNILGEEKAAVTLVGNTPVSTKVGQNYLDAGVTIKFDGETYTHVWNSGDMNLIAVKDGYKLDFNATTLLDPAEATGMAERIVNVTSLSAVGGFYLATGNGFVDLHWTNPVDPDFLGVNIYRSTVPGEAGKVGTFVYRTSAATQEFEDDSVVNGTTYYYVLKAVYKGVDGDIESPASPELSATPQAPKLAMETVSFGSDTGLSGTEKTGEVKSGNTNENKEEKKKDEDKSNTLSMIGAGLLVLLVLVGLYLLYVQNPEWFEWLFFWKKKSKK